MATYRTMDGSVFNTPQEAMEHERKTREANAARLAAAAPAPSAPPPISEPFDPDAFQPGVTISPEQQAAADQSADARLQRGEISKSEYEAILSTENANANAGRRAEEGARHDANVAYWASPEGQAERERLRQASLDRSNASRGVFSAIGTGVGALAGAMVGAPMLGASLGGSIAGLDNSRSANNQIQNQEGAREAEQQARNNQAASAGAIGGGALGTTSQALGGSAANLQGRIEENAQTGYDDARQAGENLRAIGQRNAVSDQNAAVGFDNQARQAGNRAAPTIAEDPGVLAQQQAAVDNLGSFQAGGAAQQQTLDNFQAGGAAEQAALNSFQAGGGAERAALNSFQAGGGSEQAALNAHQAGGGAQIAALSGHQADRSGIGALQGFQGDTSGVAALQDFQAGREGVDRLNEFAEGPTGPSAAEAMLRLQSSRDMSRSLALARSARGGAGAVAEAMKQAQGEQAYTSSQTRGQMALVQADEAAKRRQESLSALTSAAQVGSAQDRTDLGALQSASGDLLAGSAQNLSAAQAASNNLLTASGQEMSAQQAAGQIDVARTGQNADAIASAGNIATTRSGQQLSATQAAGTMATTQSGQQLSATQSAANTATTRSGQQIQAATAAGNIATTRSGQQLQAQTSVSNALNAMRDADINVLKANQSAALKSLALNDEQTRAFAGMAEDARNRANDARRQAELDGQNADEAANAIMGQSLDQMIRLLSNEQRAKIDAFRAQNDLAATTRSNDRQDRNDSRQNTAQMVEAGIKAVALIDKLFD